MAPKGKTPNVQQTINQARKNLAATAPGGPKPMKAKGKLVKAAKPKLPAQTRGLVNKQKQANKSAMW